jgi:hypothetical protein
VPNPINPQTLNRYSYCGNNPLKYIDPSGHEVNITGTNVSYLDNISLSDYLMCMSNNNYDLLLLYGAYAAVRSWVESGKDPVVSSSAIRNLKSAVNELWRKIFCLKY